MDVETLVEFICTDQKPLPAEMAAVLTPETRWDLYTESNSTAAAEIEGRQYPILHRWNFQERDDGLYACRHLHDKGQPCEYERLTEVMIKNGARFGGGEVNNG